MSLIETPTPESKKPEKKLTPAEMALRFGQPGGLYRPPIKYTNLKDITKNEIPEEIIKNEKKSKIESNFGNINYIDYKPSIYSQPVKNIENSDFKNQTKEKIDSNNKKNQEGFILLMKARQAMQTENPSNKFGLTI